jgi:CBS domain containing-hemolysin-like protein
MNNIFFVVLALFFVALNGFFVAAEFSLVKMRPTRVRAIAKTHGLTGRILAKIHSQLDAYLSACQLGITLASLGLGWIGEPAFANLLDPLFSLLGITSIKLIHSISFAFAFVTISFLHIVVGELAPKSMAIRNPEGIGLWGAIPLYSFYWLMYPAIWVLNSSANVVLHLAGLNVAHSHDSHYSAEELKMILRSSRPSEQFTRKEWNILAKTLDFSRLEVSDLMRPIHEVVALYESKSLAQNLHTMQIGRFSRYPFFDHTGINVLGILHLKDLFLAQQEGKSIEDLRQYLRPVHTISAHTPALELFRHFSKGVSHFAVIGEKGEKPQGFITFDNLLGAMVGSIRDEFCQIVNDWTLQDDGTLIGKGSLPIFSLERILGLDIENEELEQENVDSVGGLIMAKLRDIPSEGQKIQFDDFEIEVLKMNSAQIVNVKVYPKLQLQ